MKRAALFACLLAFAAPAFAQGPGVSSGPIADQTTRDGLAAEVRAGRSQCADCDLFQADLSYLDLANHDFSGSRLRQADLSLSQADGARFRGANLSIANMFGGRFARADFTRANLSRAVLVGAYLGGARFEGAVLLETNLSGAELSHAVGLTQSQLNTACGDASTVLPPGMTIPAC